MASGSELQNSMDGVLMHSEATKRFLGKRKNARTESATLSGMRAWFRAMFEADVFEECPEEKEELDFIWEKMVENVLVGYQGGSQLSTLQIQNLNVSLGHFVSAYRKSTGGRVTPSTMIGYIDGIQRYLQEDKDIDINIKTHKIFVHKESGYRTAFENIAKAQQAAGVHRKPYNIILDSEMDRMLSHKLTDPSKPRSYITRTVIIVGLLTGLRPGALRLLTWSNFTEKLDTDGKNAFLYKGSVGSTDGDCKNAQGGINSSRDVPTHFYISDCELAYGINPYKAIRFQKDECIKAGGGKPEDPFFMAANQRGTSGNLLRKGVVGRNLFRTLFTEVIDECEVVGVGFQDKPKVHSLRSTLISKLQEMGHTESQIIQRTGHKSITSLKSYTVIAGSQSAVQQEHIFSQRKVVKNSKVGSSSDIMNPKSIESKVSSVFNNITANNITINYYEKSGKSEILKSSKSSESIRDAAGETTN